MAITPAALRSLAPTGVLRAGINLSNFLLVPTRGPAGEPEGVAPDLAAALATRLGLPLELVPYANPGALGDAVHAGRWDVGLIGAEPKRAETIGDSSGPAATLRRPAPPPPQPPPPPPLTTTSRPTAFTPGAYCEIEATYLVPPGSPLTSIEAVNQPGNRVVVSARSAYGVWLEANLDKAALLPTATPGLDLSRELYLSELADGEGGPATLALAGLRPWLLKQPLEGALLPGKFMSVQQAVGVPRNDADECQPEVVAVLGEFIEEAKSTGLVEELIEKHGATGKLSVAPPCS